MIVPVRTERPLRKAAAGEELVLKIEAVADAEFVLKIPRLVLKIEAAADEELVLTISVFALRLDEWKTADIER